MNAGTRRVLAAATLLALAGTAMAGDDRGYAAELLADASGRQAAPQAPKAFSVNVHGFVTFRYNWNHRDDDDLEDKDTVGFQSAYTKIQIGGNIISEAWTYGIQFKFSESDGSSVLDDAWGNYAAEEGWNIKWGQFKLPLLREELVSDTAQLAANRSVTNSVFSQSRSQGVQLSREMDQARVFFAFSDGLATRNTDYTSASEADWAFTGRVEWKWAGEWKQAKDFTSFQNSNFFGMIGGAAHYQSGGDTFATADTTVFQGTVDLSLEGNGWNAFAAGIYRHLDPNPGDSLADWGFIAQGGVFLAPQWELFGRYDLVVPDDDRTADDNFSTITIGVNHYFVPESHAAKFTANVLWFLDTQADSGEIVRPSTLTGLLASDEDSQWALQLQMQLVF
jgi:hypothetical protein